MSKIFPSLVVAGVLAGGGAQAAPLEGWVVDLGARLGASPKWEGSDDTQVRVTPTLVLRRANPERRFTPPDPGATFGLIDTGRVTAGPVVVLRSKRDNDDELVGLRKVKRAAEVGGFVDVWPANWLRLHLQARRGVAGHSAWLGDAGFDLVYSARRWDASIGPRVSYASDSYMDKYFGVTPEEAALNPAITAAYAPSGGARSIGGRAAFAYYVNDRWRASADLGYARLGDRAADSPIVRTLGSRDQVTAGVSLAYTFGLPFGRR